MPEDSPARPAPTARPAATGTPAAAAVEARLKALIRDVPDFPKPGVLFRDITPLLGDAAGFAEAIDALHAGIAGWNLDGLVAIESRGFLFGAALALRAGLPLQLVRKPGKLPRRVEAIDYALEYGSDRLELHADAVRPGGRYAIVDDVLATGGTASATASLVRKLGAEPAGVAVLIELSSLEGRQRLAGLPVARVVAYP